MDKKLTRDAPSGQGLVQGMRLAKQVVMAREVEMVTSLAQVRCDVQLRRVEPGSRKARRGVGQISINDQLVMDQGRGPAG